VLETKGVSIGYRQRGFTVTEILVVLAIVGIVATLAVNADAEDTATADAYSEVVAAELESGRLAAIGTRRWHRLTFTAGGVVVERATTTGMSTPVAYTQVSTYNAPVQTKVHSYEAITEVVGDGSAPTEGTGLPASVMFAPDGTASAATIYVTDARNVSRFRVATFRSTGLSRVYEGW
jgi:prepilin-type N-terminal cleavage/methylation domain-containing protein